MSLSHRDIPCLDSSDLRKIDPEHSQSEHMRLVVQQSSRHAGSVDVTPLTVKPSVVDTAWIRTLRNCKIVATRQIFLLREDAAKICDFRKTLLTFAMLKPGKLRLGEQHI
jgi:hypothetical protein